MQLRRSPLTLVSFLLALVLSLSFHAPAWANFGVFNVLLPESNLDSLLPNDGNELIVERCVYLDGNCLFKVAAPRSEIDTRLSYIQTQLTRVKEIHDEINDPDVVVRRDEQDDNLSNIIIEIQKENEDGTTETETIRLMTVTRWDAELKGDDIAGRTTKIIEQIEAGLTQSEQERSPEYVQQQGIIAGSLAFVGLALSVAGGRWRKRLRRKQEQEAEFPQGSPRATPISTQLNLRQLYNLQEVKLRISQLLQGGAPIAAAFFIIGLFPQTRMIQVWSLGIFRYPFLFALIFLIAYIAIRLSYALIAKTNQLLTEGALDAFAFITHESNRRLQLRVDTFSQVMRSIVTLLIVAIALLACFWVLNINIAPILAGAGIIGLAISFAAQNLLKDIINGFCIILEDQYAVGDVITVGNVAGLVENLNLRITQLRDTEGRLITVPNSEVRIVANSSNEWARADLSIPVAYQTDVDQALDLVNKVAWEMRKDEVWNRLLLEDPLLLGVDNFNERGMVIRLWLKTQPLKQWEIAREYRRRIKIAFAKAGIQIPTQQSDIWLHTPSAVENGIPPEQLSMFSSGNPDTLSP